jgi:hypothetical protein
MPWNPIINILQAGLKIGQAPQGQPFASSLCRYEDMITDEYLHVCQAIGQQPLVNRKQWEFAFIYWKLRSYNMLGPGIGGIGFGVGTEPLPAAFIAEKCKILATDAPIGNNDQGWSLSGQHASSLEALLKPEIVSDDEFRSLCDFMPLDMNNYESIPFGWQFHWSSCVIEHLGGIEQAIEFLIQSSLRLAPGGIAVHTTEFNLTSNEHTIDEPGTCILRKCDLERLCDRVGSVGLSIEPLILDPGTHSYNYHVDAPPYEGYNHLRLELGNYVATSLGVVIKRH